MYYVEEVCALLSFGAEAYGSRSWLNTQLWWIVQGQVPKPTLPYKYCSATKCVTFQELVGKSLCFPFLSVTSGFSPCASYKVIFLAAPDKWVPLSQILCLTALFHPPKNQEPLFLMLGPSIEHPNFKPTGLGPKLETSGLCLRPWEVLVSVRISCWEPLLLLSCLSPHPLCSFLSNQTGRHRSCMNTLNRRWKNINISLSSCLKVDPFKEMSPHQEEEKCFS